MVVTANDTFARGLRLKDGRIAAIADALPVENAGKVIDAAGRLVMPGGVDGHTHLDMPFGGTTSSDDFETGTTAAAYGGTTTLIDFPLQTKGPSPLHTFANWTGKADRQAALGYSLARRIT